MASASGQHVGQTSGQVGQEILLKVPYAKLWSPDNPSLYDLEVSLVSAVLHKQTYNQSVDPHVLIAGCIQLTECSLMPLERLISQQQPVMHVVVWGMAMMTRPSLALMKGPDSLCLVWSIICVERYMCEMSPALDHWCWTLPVCCPGLQRCSCTPAVLAVMDNST